MEAIRPLFDPDRLALYRYLTGEAAHDYVAIMRQFVGALLAEWSAHDLVDRGLDLPVEVVEDRLRYLAYNGNLVRSPREVRVTSVAEYQRQPARYALSTLGARVHREVEALLAASGGGREVPRELLALVAEGLRGLADDADDLTSADPRTLAERVSTLFLQFEAFAASVTDFYTYVGSVLSRRHALGRRPSYRSSRLRRALYRHIGGDDPRRYGHAFLGQPPSASVQPEPSICRDPPSDWSRGGWRPALHRRPPGKIVTVSPETMQAVDAQPAWAIREDQNPE
jgi:hypothetical protein